MGATAKNLKSEKAAIKKTEVNSANEKVEVLYQRIGDRWYAFSAVEDDVFYGAIPEDALESEKSKTS